MLKYKTVEDLMAAAELLGDSPFLAMRLRQTALLFDDIDADKAILCREAAENLEEGRKTLNDAIVLLQNKNPAKAG